MNECVCEKVLEGMSDYLAQFESNSFRKLSHYTGINRKTLSRISSRQSKLNNQDPLKLARLIKILFKHDSVEEVINSPEYALKESYESIYGAFVGFDKDQMSDSKLQTQLDDLLNRSREHFLLFILANNHTGVSYKQAIQKIGFSVWEVAKDFIELGLLKSNAEWLYPSKKGAALYFGRETIQKNMKYLIEYYSTSRSCTEQNYITHAAEALTPGAIRKIHRLTAEYHRKINCIMTDEGNRGEIPYYLVLAMDCIKERQGTINLYGDLQ